MLEQLPPYPVTASASTEAMPPLGSNINVLMIWPRFPSSFWGFEGVLEMLPEAAMTPPLGLITVAALCPPSWKIRLMDQCFQEIRDEDLLAADLVMISAMHAQRFHARDILAARESARAPHFHRWPMGQQRPRRGPAACRSRHGW